MCDDSDHDHSRVHGHSRTSDLTSSNQSRRRFLLSVGATATAATAGCLGLGGTAEAPDPISLESRDHICELCGMVIPMHPGPIAQIFYKDHKPDGPPPKDNPARFCSNWEAFKYEYNHENRGWNSTAFYTTDYSSVDYELYEEGDDTYITAHFEPETFADATELTYLVGSDIKGAMSRDLIGFSEKSEVEKLQTEYGGDIMEYGDVSIETVGVLENSYR
ncbi:MAG: nitrous oxide reductase accessory protein NosL [Halobacteria archaeon]|nr:nitrous oxide reductase accessory protein NosL [Halobacteria archaeon]